MKKLKLILMGIILTLSLTVSVNNVQAQSKPVVYFCEKYDSDRGEIGVSDRFTKGYITVMAKSADPMGLSNVKIQYDKYDCYSKKFNYYKSFSFDVKPSMKYIYFSKTEGNDMSFDETGFYRVYLLDERGKTVASALIEIIP